MSNQQAKADAGKPQIHLIPPKAIIGEARIREYGVEKYGDPDNWRKVEDIRYIDAALRHILHMLENGMDAIDEESGLPAVDHARCSLGFISQRVHEREVKNKWIPTEKRLPEDDGEVLVAIRYGDDLPDEKPTTCCGYLLDGEWWTYMEHNCGAVGSGPLGGGDAVTHWMPLPVPPERGEDNER